MSIWIGEKNAGIFVGGLGGSAKTVAAETLAPHTATVEQALAGPKFDPTNAHGHVYYERFAKSYVDRQHWPDITDWMEERRLVYLETLNAVLAQPD